MRRERQTMRKRASETPYLFCRTQLLERQRYDADVEPVGPLQNTLAGDSEGSGIDFKQDHVPWSQSRNTLKLLALGTPIHANDSAPGPAPNASPIRHFLWHARLSAAGRKGLGMPQPC